MRGEVEAPEISRDSIKIGCIAFRCQFNSCESSEWQDSAAREGAKSTRAYQGIATSRGSVGVAIESY